MHAIDTSLDGVKLLQAKRFGDDRGWFAEMWSTAAFGALGLPTQFVQDNQSSSRRGVLRGLHYQLGKPQGKLVRALSGEIWDVAVDIRRGSPQFGQWASFRLAPQTPSGDLQMLWIPPGFAHGFLVVSEQADVFYKVTDVYHPQGERTILWDDPTLRIAWPLDELRGSPVSISAKDAQGATLTAAELPSL